MTTCPKCKKIIDDDGYYCEHCGEELYVCPKCFPVTRVYGKGAGKRCGNCGEPLVAAKTLGSAAPAIGDVPKVTVTAQPVQNATTPPPPIANQAASLFCAAMNTRIQLRDNAMIGRVQGDYVSQLGTFQYISGIHARLNFDGQQWTITDLGSRNGTRVNGLPCAPALSFRKGDVIRIANFYDFKVE